MISDRRLVAALRDLADAGLSADKPVVDHWIVVNFGNYITFCPGCGQRRIAERSGRYCSAACKQRAYRGRHEK